jgi:hypothetical protein
MFCLINECGEGEVLFCDLRVEYRESVMCFESAFCFWLGGR